MLPLIIVGAGGHSKVLINALRLSGSPKILGITDADKTKHGMQILGVNVEGDDTWVLKHKPSEVLLVNAVGSIGSTAARRKVYERFREQGYRFASIRHPSAIVAEDVVIEDGVQLMAGAVVQPGGFLGENCIINTNATVDHDGKVGPHSHVAPGASLCGYVTLERGVHIGTGAVVIQSITVGRDAIVGAGAVVVKTVEPEAKVIGNPAGSRI